jgi:hypothetical protein
MTRADAQPLRYVLSAGRTGTVFLQRLLSEHLDGVTASFEPAGTRYQMMLANFRNDWGIGGRAFKWLFERARDRRVEAATGVYVEINSFLCAMTDLLPKPGRGLRIVHMVRDPATWAVSMATFKARTQFRHVIDYIPFAKPYPVPRPEGWRGLGEYERALWRWNWCNERINQLRPIADAYALVRYENLFASEPEARIAALETIGTTLDLPGRLADVRADMADRANPSPGKGHNIDRPTAKRICGQLARDYGYDY